VQHIGDFTYARLADFGAAISGANKLQCQQVLEELDVSKFGVDTYQLCGVFFCSALVSK
jgi:hypothetical protein